MSFLTPAYLALATLAIPVIVLYMLRLRRREVPVSSTLLWQRLMQDREANAPWQRLRRTLLLSLQLLILAALVVALARPFITVPAVASGSVALLVDASASMNAADMPGGITRFDAARDQARALLSDLAGGEAMTVIAAGPTPQVLTPPTTDHAALREAINRARPTSAAADWEAALALAGASVAGREQPTIVVISDGGLPDDLPPLPAEVRYLRVGRQAHNLAISALAVRPLEDRPQLFAAVTNYGPQDAAVILSLTVDGALFSADRLEVPAGQTITLTTADLPPEVRIIRAELTTPVEGGLPDYLPLDDSAYAVYRPPVGGRVLLVTEGNLFLRQVLAAMPGIEAFRARPGEMPQGTFELVIFDGWLPADLPDSNLLIINPPQTSDLFILGEPFTETRFVRQADDPILSFVDFQNVAVREAVRVETPGWARVLVEAEGGPLLLTGTVGGRRVAILTFDLHASDLPLRVEFPILIANLFEWFAPAHPFDAPDTLTPGDAVTIRPQPATTAYRVTLPDGSQQTFPLTEQSMAFADTQQLGVYTVELLAGDQVTGSGSFAVNLFAPDESAIAPRDAIQAGQVAVTGAGQGEEVGQRELWPWLVTLALAILLAEWWVYQRGSAITRRERAERRAKPCRRLLYFGRRN